MSNPRKQHYVPQLYLKNFAYGSSKTPKLYVLSIDQDKIFPASVCDTAAERDFYTVDSADDKYMWERCYAERIEPILDNLLKSLRSRCENVLIQNHVSVINPEEKVRLALSIVFQLLRGKQTRVYEQKLFDRFLPEVQAKARKRFSPIDEEKERLLKAFADDDKYFKEIAMQTIFREESIRLYLDILVQRTFILYKITGENSFVTSDNPVMLIDSTTHDATPFRNGMMNTSTLIYYPLSPKLLLGAYHPDMFLGALNERDCCIELLDGTKEQRFILTQNRKQKSQCYNYVYAQSPDVLRQL